MIAPTHSNSRDRAFANNRRKVSEKLQLMEEHPHCEACDRELTLEPFLPNSAHLVKHSLSCPDHVKAVRKLAKLGYDKAVIVLTEKGQQYLDTHRPVIRERYFVESKAFNTLWKAEEYAIELATLLGAKFVILRGLELATAKPVEIIRPGANARFRDTSFHRDRTRLVVLPAERR